MGCNASTKLKDLGWEPAVGNLSAEEKEFVFSILKESPTFFALGKFDIDECLAYFTYKSLGAGVNIYERGGESDSCLFILDGQVWSTSVGNNQTLINKGSLVGDYAMVHNLDRNQAIDTFKACKILKMMLTDYEVLKGKCIKEAVSNYRHMIENLKEFKGVSKEQHEELERFYKVEEYPAGKIIDTNSTDDLDHRMRVIYSGLVRLEFPSDSEEKSEKILGQVLQNEDIFADGDLLKPQFQSIKATAKETTYVITLPLMIVEKHVKDIRDKINLSLEQRKLEQEKVEKRKKTMTRSMSMRVPKGKSVHNLTSASSLQDVSDLLTDSKDFQRVPASNDGCNVFSILGFCAASPSSPPKATKLR